MRDSELWRPTKFIRSDHYGWRVSRNPDEVGIGSRIIGDLMAALYASAIKTYAKGHLIDLGCGKVPLYGMYQDGTTAVTCVDWANSLHKTSHIDHYVDLNKELQFSDNTFDTALCADVLEHIWRHDVLWHEMSRVLKPGGHLILGTPFLYMIHEPPHDYFRWTSFSLRQACKDVGLDVIELMPVGGVLEVLADFITKLVAVKSMRVATGLAAILSRVLQWRPITVRSQLTSSRFTLAHVLIARKPY
jgi:SAM-dependent methyltransferase